MFMSNPSDAGVFLTDRAINAEFFVVGPNKLLSKQSRYRHGLLCMYLRGVGDWRCLDFNTLRPGQISHHVTDDTFKCIILNENIWI